MGHGADPRKQRQHLVGDDRPAVIVSLGADRASDLAIHEVLAGVEEEGVPARLIDQSDADGAERDDIVERAHLAAQRTVLGVGIALGAHQVCLHLARFDHRQPLLLTRSDNPDVLRGLGHNAARLVKVTPLKPMTAVSITATTIRKGEIR